MKLQSIICVPRGHLPYWYLKILNNGPIKYQNDEVINLKMLTSAKIKLASREWGCGGNFQPLSPQYKSNDHQKAHKK